MSDSVSDDVRLGHGHGGSLHVSVKHHIATVTMCCGENRFNPTTIARINAALDQAESDSDVHALVVTGEGKFFCAGLDLPWMVYRAKTKRLDELASFLKSFQDLVIRVLTFPMPTVALMNGHAAAGGALLALAFDVRIMRRDRGYFYINEVRLGLSVDGFLRDLVMTKIPQGAALTEAVVFGNRLTGPDTLRLGITSALCERQELQETGHQMARQILADGAYNRATFRKNKEIMYINILEARRTPKGGLKPENFVAALAKAKM